jgi:hypothetical protein
MILIQSFEQGRDANAECGEPDQGWPQGTLCHVFDFTLDRGRKGPKQFLKDYN